MDRRDMDSPFPGMDPYLEQPGWWRGFHVMFLADLVADLNATLPDPYTAGIEESVHLVEMDAPSMREAIPDGFVLRGEGPTGPAVASTGGGAAMLAPVLIAHPRVEEVKTRWVEVRHAPGRELVAVIELLSPTNKGVERTEYLAKRGALMAQPVHLIEVDLLLGGRRLPMAQPLPPGDYYAMVSRAGGRPLAEVYAWSVRDRLPAVPVPLREPDADLSVDLQLVFAATYRRGGYARRLSYAGPPQAKLSDADLAWAASLARAGAAE